MTEESYRIAVVELLSDLLTMSTVAAVGICIISGMQIWRFITIAKNQRKLW